MALVLPERRLLAVPMPPPDQYRLLDDIFRTWRVHTRDGGVLVLPHADESLRILRNMGVNVDGCEMFDWYYTPPMTKDGKKPWWWQLETAAFLAQNPAAFVTSTPRTGKTLSTLMAVDYVQQQHGGAALIVAPLTVAHEGEWARTCREWFPKKRVQLVHKDREQEVRRRADIYLINPDGLKIVGEQLSHMVRLGGIRCVVFDELTEYANPRSQRWKAAQLVAKDALFRWGLTGTPGKPDKIYGQVKLINPRNVPTTFTRWREETEIKVSQFKWVPKHGYEETVKQAMSPCIRFDKEELMKIPVPQVLREEVPLSREQADMTERLVEDLRVMVDSGEVDVSAANSLAIKLLQISGGVVRAKNAQGEGVLHRLDATPKVAKLVELLRRTPRKKVVFSSFTAVNDMLVEEIREAGFTCDKIDGSVTGTRRSQLLADFLDKPDPHVLVCHPRTTAFGVELASADYIICYGTPITGAFMYQQMFERLSSSRQTASETFVVHLAAGRQDKLAFSALENGVNIERNIVNLFTTHISEFD